MSLLPQASAQPVTPENFPPCKTYVLADKTTVCGYSNVEDWKKVLKADAELTAKKKMLDLEVKHVADLLVQVFNYEGQVKALQSTIQIQKDQVNKLITDLLKTDQLYQQERIKPRWGSAIAWTTAAVAAAVLTGFVLKDAL